MEITRTFLGRQTLGICSLLFGSLFFASCADDLTENRDDSSDGLGPVVSFHVQPAQDEVFCKPASAMPMTRTAFASHLSGLHLAPADLTPGKINCTGQPNTCLIQTTTADISNPIAQNARRASTRANITTMETLKQFSSIGFRGDSPDNINTPWFGNQETNPDGTLVNPVKWDWNIRWGQFYAVYPLVTSSYSKLSLSSQSQRPSVDFEVETAVRNQKDLMTATTDRIEYATQGVAPPIPLSFTHALTAVQFKVGSNLSYNKTITKVEIIGAKNKGHYMLPFKVKGLGSWSNLSGSATFTLDNLNISTGKSRNTLLTGISGDNYTFYMIPQDLSGVSVKVYFSDNTTINANLKGQWKPGTTVQYGLSETSSTWDYTLAVTNATETAYNETSTSYTVQSYRHAPDGTQQPVAWKVVGYDANNDDTFSMNEKPAWLTSLDKTSSTGSITPENCTATLKTDIIDKLAPYNKVLQTATPRGSVSDPYDLSVHNYKGKVTNMNTANSYLISAPGYYRIPLVYGNAITDGATNEHAYKTKNKVEKNLSTFRDHLENDITSPYINVQNSGDPATQASIVWTDQYGIVKGLSVTGSGSNSYVNFHVPADKIKNGNAVIAVKNASGTIMWSWHLWFAYDDALDVIPCTNYQGVTYKFTKQTLGFAKTWEVTTYDQPRTVRVKVEQLVGTNGVKQSAIISITQKPRNGEETFLSTLYQFGRKDALPGTEIIAEGSFNAFNNGDKLIGSFIQHPNTFYEYMPYKSMSLRGGYGITNFWSADATEGGWNDNAVIKTIYDPCPAGFKMPASNAFTGFTTTGKKSEKQSEYNVSGDWDMGWHFNNKITNPTATLYFPALSRRNHVIGGIINKGEGYYWSATSSYSGFIMSFSQQHVNVMDKNLVMYACSVRPVAE